jgi:NAD(P)H-nitrite reductase large subunit
MISDRNRDTSGNMRYVIVGNSAGGTAAIEAIRQCDEKGRITVISEEPYFNYSRPMISYLLAKKVTLNDMPYRKREFYKDNDVELILGTKAEKLVIEDKYVILSGGQKVPFDKLLLATGGTPIVPKVKGSNLDGVFTFTSLADALKIKEHINNHKVEKAVVLGAGLIGLKATEALLELRMRVTIVEMSDRILSTTFDEKASSIMRTALEKTGCGLFTGNTIAAIEGRNRIKQVILKDRQKIPADLAIIATGVKSNIELVNETPVKTNRGILADEFMQTNVKDVYAAGDCCEAKDSLSGINHPIPIWPAAVRQGKIAGFNMAGSKKEYRGSFAMNSVELCGIPTISMGQTAVEEKDCQVLQHSNAEKNTYRKIVLKNNRMIGAILVGNIERAGIYTGLIKDKVDTASFREQLLGENFGLISLPEEYRKHLVTGDGGVF